MTSTSTSAWWPARSTSRPRSAAGCICCLPDDGGLDDALVKLADPARRLDAIVVEASGLADPVAIARIIGFSEIRGVRAGGLVDVVDAVNHFDTVDCGTIPPVRYGAASLIVVNKLDQVPEQARSAVVQRVTQLAAQRNPRIHVVGTTAGRIDPKLLFDASATSGQVGQLSFLDLAHEYDRDHVHADAVTVSSSGCVDPDALFDLLEDPPPQVFRLKGIVSVRHRTTVQDYVVNLVGDAIHMRKAPPGATANCLVAIGMHLDTHTVHADSTTRCSRQRDRRRRRHYGGYSCTGASARKTQSGIGRLAIAMRCNIIRHSDVLPAMGGKG